ncbi:MAG: hypothetical protein ABR905_07825 [Terracidiphilus sp.]
MGLNFEIHGSYTAQIFAISSSYLMDIAPLKQYCAEQTISAVASALADRTGIDISVKTADRKALKH